MTSKESSQNNVPEGVVEDSELAHRFAIATNRIESDIRTTAEKALDAAGNGDKERAEVLLNEMLQKRKEIEALIDLITGINNKAQKIIANQVTTE